MDNKKKKYTNEEFILNTHEYDIDIDANHIYLFGDQRQAIDEDDQEPGINYVIANRFIRNLNILSRKNPNKPILVHMKTCGGYWQEGMAIYDTIKLCPNYITILSYTHARSMSSLILQAADKRVLMPNSIFMFHDGSMSASGTTKQFLTEATELKKSMTTMRDIYVNSMRNSEKFSGWADKKIHSWLKKQMNLKEDVFLSAEEAVECGFADEIYDGVVENLLNFKK